MVRSLPGAARYLRSPWAAMESLRRQGPINLLGLTLVLAPLGIGGVPMAPRIVVSAMAVLILGWVAHERTRQGRPLVVGWAGLGLLLLLGWTWLQWIPLPAGLVALVAPEAAELRTGAAEAMGIDAPGWHALSFDRGATAGAWVTLAGVVAIYLITANVGRDLAERRAIGKWVVIAGLGTLLVSIGHVLFDATRIYGLYEASVDLASLPIMSSFVNPNHAAALMMLAAVVALGLSFPTDSQPRIWLMVAWVLLSLGVIASLSRANTMLLAVALVVMASSIAIRHRGTATATRMGRTVVGTLGLGAIAVMVLGTELWLQEMGSFAALFHEGPVWPCWTLGLQVASDHLWTGVGHGAFAAAASQVMTGWEQGLISFTHSVVLQAVADWGLPVALTGIGLLMMGYLGVLRRWRSDHTTTACVVGLTALALQNQVDFSLAFPGVAFPAAAVFGWSVGNGAYGRREGPERQLRWRWPTVVTFALFAALLLTSFDAWSHRTASWDARVRAAVDEGHAPVMALDEMLVSHPGDFHLFRLGAVVASNSGMHERARRLADRAVALAPFEADTLLTRARLALGQGRFDDAAEDLSRAARLGPRHLEIANQLVLGHADAEDLMERYFGEDAERAVRASEQLISVGKRQTARRLLGWTTERFPDALALREAHTALVVDEARGKGAEDPARTFLNQLSIDYLARGAEDTDPTLAAGWRRLGYLTQGFVIGAEGRHREAIHLFTEAAELDPDRASWPLTEVANLRHLTGDLEGLVALLPQLDGATRGDDLRRARYFVLASHAAELSGQPHEALRLAQRAVRFRPNDPRIRDRVATLLSLNDDMGGARAERARAERLRAATSRPRPAGEETP